MQRCKGCCFLEEWFEVLGKMGLEDVGLERMLVGGGVVASIGKVWLGEGGLRGGVWILEVLVGRWGRWEKRRERLWGQYPLGV